MPEAVKRVIEKCGVRFVKESTRTTMSGEEHHARYYVMDNVEMAVIQKAQRDDLGKNTRIAIFSLSKRS